jgi:GDP-mannose 6-dehydrogenase
MRIAILGAGYVGVVSAACLTRDGHEVTLVEPVAAKVEGLNRGESPVLEPGVADLIKQAHSAGALRATSDPVKGLRDVEMIWVCVGTPSGDDGGVELGAIEKALMDVGQALVGNDSRPVVVVRSTVVPGTTEERLIPALESAGVKVGVDVDVVFHPEFLREGSGIADFDDPSKIVIGETTPKSGGKLAAFYADASAEVFLVAAAEAELVKYADNMFHAVKITFANEVGALAQALDLDGREILEIVRSDTKLNVSPAYLKPGFAYGGSCLPKDTRALSRLAELRSVRLPLLESLAASNDIQVDRFVNRVLRSQPDTVGIVGLAFKKGTDDMRESPYVKVAKRLIGEGVTLRIYDPFVDPINLIGSNRLAVEKALGHLEGMMVHSLEELSECDVIAVNHGLSDSDQVVHWLDSGVRVLDNAGGDRSLRTREGYEGVAW